MRSARRSVGTVLMATVLAACMPAGAMAGDVPSIGRSILVPGLGQAHMGHYKKAAIFAGTAVFTGIGLWVSAIYYNEAVTKYEDNKRVYLSYPDLLAGGEVINIQQIDQTYNDMLSAFNEADDRLVWRNVFLVGFIGVYTLNLIDVIISKPHELDPDELEYSIEADRKRVLVTRSFRF